MLVYHSDGYMTFGVSLYIRTYVFSCFFRSACQSMILSMIAKNPEALFGEVPFEIIERATEALQIALYELLD